MITLQQTRSESPGGDNSSESLLHKSSQVQLVAGDERDREIVTISNEEYEETSVHIEDEEWEWEHQKEQPKDQHEQLAHEHEYEHHHEMKLPMHDHDQYQPHKHGQHHHHHHYHHHDQQLQQQHLQQQFFQLQQVESIEELLGSSIESIDGDVDDDDDDDDDIPTPLAWRKTEFRNQTEALLMQLEDSPNTRIRKMIEADDLVSEDEEDDIDSEDGSMYEEYESPASSDDYDDITDEEDDDDDAWSADYIYEEIELPDHITPIQKNWMNSWFCSTHRRRMEQISEGEEENCHSDSEGSISLKDGKSSKGNDLDKSWGSLDSHMRSWHSQRSHRSPHYPVTSPPHLVLDIKALLPAKSPIRPSLPKARMSDQPKQAETLVRSKEAVEEQELNDSLRLGDRTAFLKAKRKAAALKKPRQKKKDKGKQKGKTATNKDTIATGAKQKQTRKTKSSSSTGAPESTASSLMVPPPPPPDQPDAPIKSETDTRDNVNNEVEVQVEVEVEINNNVSDSKSKSRRKSTTLKLDSSTHERSKSARTLEGAEVENSVRSKSKSKRNSTSKSKSSKSNSTSSSTDKEVEKSDRSISKSARRLKVAAIDETQPLDGDSTSNRRRKIKDNSESPVKTKKRSKPKQDVTVDADADAKTDLDGGLAHTAETPSLLESSTGPDDTSGSARQDAMGEKGSQVLFSDQEDSTHDDANSKSTNQDADSFHKPDSKRSKRGKNSLTRHQSLPNVLSSIPDDDCETSSKASTIKTSEKKRGKSPKARKDDIRQLPSQLHAATSSTPLDTPDPCKPPSEQSLKSMNIPSDDSVHQDAEGAATPTTSKSPRNKAKAKINAPSDSSLDVDTTKKLLSRRSSGKSSTPKNSDNAMPADDENSSIKTRSTSARSKSRSSKSRKKSDDKSQSKHKTIASLDDESPPTPKSSSSGKRGGRRPGNILEEQRPSDPNLATTTWNDDDTTDRPVLAPRKAKSMVNLNYSKAKSPSPSRNMANSSWDKVESPSETLFLQLDITNDGDADAKQLSTTRPVRPSLLSQMSWNEKMSSGRVDAKAPMSLRDLKVTGSLSGSTQEGGGNPLEELDTPSTSNRKAGFFRFLISPLKRAKSFSVDRSKKTLKEQSSRRSMLLSPVQGSSRSVVAKENDKKSHSLHQFATVTFTDGTSSRPLPDDKTSVSIKQNASNATSNDGHNGTKGDCIKSTAERRNFDHIKGALFFLQKDDSAGTIKTSMMSLSLDEEGGTESNNLDPLADEAPTPDNCEGAKNSLAHGGRVQVKANSFRVTTNNWKSVFSEDQEAASRRTSA